MRTLIVFGLLSTAAFGQMKPKPKALSLIEKFPRSSGGFEKSASNADQLTLMHHNGRYWVSITQPMKTSFIIGVMEASNFHPTEEVLPKDLTVGEISAELDLFFNEGSNRLIPVYFALYYVRAKSVGSTSVELDELVSRMRKVCSESE